MKKVTFNNFSGGIVNDSRDTTNGVARVVSNFDINSSPNRLIPYRASVDGNSNSANDLMQNWLIALRTGTTYNLYGLGRQTAADKVRIFYKGITTGGSNDLDDNAWTETANNLGANAVPNYDFFLYYKNRGLIYGAAGQNIYSYEPNGGAFVDTVQALTYTTMAQGLVHSKDDVMYVPYDNKIASKNGAAAFNLTALTLPASHYITSICEFGNYIAIACAPLDGISNSKVFLWDRSSTIATITESIDWGYGAIKVLEEINGYIVGISLDGGVGGLSTRFNDRLIFRYYTGAGSQTAKEVLGTTASILRIAKQKINNRIFFMASITLNGAVREGVFSFGGNVGNFNLVHERTPNNDTALVGGALRNFFYIGDYLFQAFTINAGTHTVMKTYDVNSLTYTATSIFESTINPNMEVSDRLKMKQLTSISVGYKTLSTVAGQVVVKYKVDGGSYTTALTAIVTGVQVNETKDAVGVAFTAGREYEFRIESTLGADVISFNYGYEIIPTLA